MTAATVIACACGRAYTLAQWSELIPCGIIEDDVEGLELRQCVCGSTVSMAMVAIELVVDESPGPDLLAKRFR